MLLTENSSVEEVQTWFSTYDNGIFSDLAPKFCGLNGRAMLGFKEEQLQTFCGQVMGSAIYNSFHTQAPTGTP